MVAPRRSPVVRPAAVAGLFYPDVPDVLRRKVEEFLAAPPGRSGRGPVDAPPKAVIAPHAGYPFSGPTAGVAFRALTGRSRSVEHVVLLGPSHRLPFRGLATPGADAYSTPLGEVPVDAGRVAAVEAHPAVAPLPAAHGSEHSLEVELPFLQVLFGRFTLLPLVVGAAAPEEVEEVLELAWGGPETAVVVSSDLSHHLPYDEARMTDQRTAERIRACAGPLDPSQACGAHPINGLLRVAARRGLRVEILDLRSSGDTAGDRSRVVGYGAFAFSDVA